MELLMETSFWPWGAKSDLEGAFRHGFLMIFDALTNIDAQQGRDNLIIKHPSSEWAPRLQPIYLQILQVRTKIAASCGSVFKAGNLHLYGLSMPAMPCHVHTPLAYVRWIFHVCSKCWGACASILFLLKIQRKKSKGIYRYDHHRLKTVWLFGILKCELLTVGWAQEIRIAKLFMDLYSLSAKPWGWSPVP